MKVFIDSVGYRTVSYSFQTEYDSFVYSTIGTSSKQIPKNCKHHRSSRWVETTAFVQIKDRYKYDMSFMNMNITT